MQASCTSAMSRTVAVAGYRAIMREGSRKRPPAPSHTAKPIVPFPNFPHPTPDQCLAVRDDLLAFHGFPEDFADHRERRNGGTKLQVRQGDEETVLDGLVGTLLSQNTTETNSRKAFLSLKSTFPTWKDVLEAEPKRLEDAIRCGGLAPTKAARIKGLLKVLMEKRGDLCLEYLRGMSVSEVKAELACFKGIGPKTVACVLMFNLQQDDLPVDTHVLRISKAIGWVPDKADREKAYLHLNNRVPDELKFDLNCLLFTHGKACQSCAKKGTNSRQSGATLPDCPLKKYYVSTGKEG